MLVILRPRVILCKSRTATVVRRSGDHSDVCKRVQDTDKLPALSSDENGVLFSDDTMNNAKKKKIRCFSATVSFRAWYVSEGICDIFTWGELHKTRRRE